MNIIVLSALKKSGRKIVTAAESREHTVQAVAH